MKKKNKNIRLQQRILKAMFQRGKTAKGRIKVESTESAIKRGVKVEVLDPVECMPGLNRVGRYPQNPKHVKWYQAETGDIIGDSDLSIILTLIATILNSKFIPMYLS